MGKAKTKVIRLVKNFLDKLKSKYKISKTILFGSRVRGEGLKGSDVDLILVSEDFRGLGFRERIEQVLEFWDDWSVPLEPLCYTPEEFEEKSKQICIVREAVRTGKVIK